MTIDVGATETGTDVTEEGILALEATIEVENAAREGGGAALEEIVTEIAWTETAGTAVLSEAADVPVKVTI